MTLFGITEAVPVWIGGAVAIFAVVAWRVDKKGIIAMWQKDVPARDRAAMASFLTIAKEMAPGILHMVEAAMPGAETAVKIAEAIAQLTHQLESKFLTPQVWSVAKEIEGIIREAWAKETVTGALAVTRAEALKVAPAPDPIPAPIPTPTPVS